ncbi:MAG: glycosyltransferase [Candidatus Levyibacteriota bacterium]
MKKKLSCSLGICLYNEEQNIEKLLQSVLSQKLRAVFIGEILLIISGSTDKTKKIALHFAKKNKRIKIILQQKRYGKASAVNVFIQKAKSAILVLLGGDLILNNDVVEKLVQPFLNEKIGMTGVHPVPLNNINNGLFGFAGNFLWELHHQLSLKNPKMGEVVAFRKIFSRIPISSSVDEANIEPLVKGQGYTIKYISRAIIHNKAPGNLKDFVAQRRRIFAGHIAVRQEHGYTVSSLRLLPIFFALISFFKKNKHPKYYLYAIIVICLELYSRFLGWWDFTVAKKRHTVWDTIVTTKDLSS